jgi:hypothetical protein
MATLRRGAGSTYACMWTWVEHATIGLKCGSPARGNNLSDYLWSAGTLKRSGASGARFQRALVLKPEGAACFRRVPVLQPPVLGLKEKGVVPGGG